MPLFHQAHYNKIAARLRERYPQNNIDRQREIWAQRRTVEDLACDFGYMFIEDDPNFKVLEWLDKCSPDDEQWPFSELWINYLQHRGIVTP